MKSIVGALKIEEGEIIFDGKNITENETEVKKNIGFLPENNPLYLEMYVKEYLQFVADIHQISKEKVDEIIDLVGITPEKSKKISQLSKGYKQRVGLAQAILHAPDLLILDEPTNGLDPNQILEIRNVIKEIMAQPGLVCRILELAIGHGIGEDKARRAYQMPRGGIVDAAVILQEMEETARGVDRAGVIEGHGVRDMAEQEIAVAEIVHGQHRHIGDIVGFPLAHQARGAPAEAAATGNQA
jgi:ABC-type branched-subunit amino acid transport system ATPase component